MNKCKAIDLMRTGEQDIYIKEGTTTVGELIDLLSTIPKNYKVSLSGMNAYAIAVDDESEAILIDDATWINEHIYQLNEERE